MCLIASPALLVSADEVIEQDAITAMQGSGSYRDGTVRVAVLTYWSELGPVNRVTPTPLHPVEPAAAV
jgi:hypothetical protein